MWQLQAPQLHHNEKQEERPGQTEYQEVLPMVPRAPGAQGDQALIQRLVPEGALPSAPKRRPSRGALRARGLPGAAREDNRCLRGYPAWSGNSRSWTFGNARRNAKTDAADG